MRGRVISLACGVLLLAGCSNAGTTEPMVVDSGQAAVSSEFRVSQAEIAQSVGQVLEAVGQPPGEAPPGLAGLITERKVLEDLIASFAEQEGIEVTRTQIEQGLEQLAEENGGPDALAELAAQSGIPVEEIEDTVRTNLLITAIGTELNDSDDPAAQIESARVALSAYSEEIGIAVAPRYGTWDNEQLGIISGTTLSEPAQDEATP